MKMSAVSNNAPDSVVGTRHRAVCLSQNTHRRSFPDIAVIWSMRARTRTMHVDHPVDSSTLNYPNHKRLPIRHRTPRTDLSSRHLCRQHTGSVRKAKAPCRTDIAIKFFLWYANAEDRTRTDIQCIRLHQHFPSIVQPFQVPTLDVSLQS